jgi:multiple sugar transport system substrate-binding protein
VNGGIWGVPTEINDYALIYNKDILKQAGVVDANGDAKPPKTWAEFVDTAVKTTKKDASGNIVQYGFAITKDMDWAVADPYLSLLFTNNGKYLSDDNKKCLLNSSEGVEALDAYLQLFSKGATDINSNVFDFGKGKVAMIIVAPWHEGIISGGLGDNFTKVVGVAPFPYMKTPASLQYNWFITVSSKSQNKEEAWKFISWFTSDIQPSTGTSRYGDLLARNIGAIPSRKSDIIGNPDKTQSFFKKTYTDELHNSVPEPNILNALDIKHILMVDIQSAILNEKTSKAALDDACQQIDKLLVETKN